jgi:predicted  nucleic acid-binding Zn-ribbon protein
MERTLQDSKIALDEHLKNFETKLSTETRSAQHYTERQSNVLKDGLQNMNDFVNGLKDDMQALSNEVQSLKDKK